MLLGSGKTSATSPLTNSAGLRFRTVAGQGGQHLWRPERDRRRRRRHPEAADRPGQPHRNRKHKTSMTMAPAHQAHLCNQHGAQGSQTRLGVFGDGSCSCHLMSAIPENEQDETLNQTLEEELSGILNWADPRIAAGFGTGGVHRLPDLQEAAKRQAPQRDCDPLLSLLTMSGTSGRCADQKPDLYITVQEVVFNENGNKPHVRVVRSSGS